MTSGKRWSRAILSVLMVFVLLVTQYQPVSAAGFSDVPSGAWYETYVNQLAADGIISGVGNNMFMPKKALSRAEVVAILGNIVLTSTDTNQYLNFTKYNDVGKTKWYASYINWATEAGIASGYGGGLFKPDQAITRQELAVMLTNFSNMMGYKLSAYAEEKTFVDQSLIASWASASVKTLQKAGIFTGDETNRFNPKSSATRSEAASVFYHFLNRSDNTTYQVIRKRIAGVYVTGVTFDATQYSGGIAMANDKVNGGETMSSMISRTGAKFAVNAAFFNMSTYVPSGTIIDNGKAITIFDTYAPYKTSFVLDTSGNPTIENFRTNQTATLIRDNTTINLLESVGANRSPSSNTDPTRLLYDKFWGSSVGIYARDAVAIDSNGTVINRGTFINDMAIPSGGNVLYQRNRREYEGDFFDSVQLGDTIAINNTYEGSTVGNIDLSIAAGPRIVKDGAVYGNATTYSQEGLGASDIVSASAKRVAIGVNGSKVTIITVTSCTMSKLSEIMLGAGCKDAMNLDGGGSTGLYYDGTYLSTPTRKLNNMLYFK